MMTLFTALFGSDEIDQATSKCDSIGSKQTNFGFNYALYKCPKDCFDINRHKLQYSSEIFEENVLNDLKQNIENTRQRNNYKKGQPFYLADKDHETYYKLAEQMYLLKFGIAVKCLESFYRPNSRAATTFFHLDLRLFQRSYSRNGFDAEKLEERDKWEPIFDANRVFNVWINLGETDIKNNPLGFIFDDRNNIKAIHPDNTRLNPGDYNVYYFEDMPPGSALFFESSYLVHGTVEVNNEETPRTTLEYKCLFLHNVENPPE
eukprot:NODE_977_length_2811_cov_0.444322.p2 type:complete len:262 gc:universal NODE_977_length_2811_cov_0.444322:1059-274(-)